MDPQATLKTYFGYEHFRGKQADIIDHVLQQKNALVLMPTGMGKSLCFQIPALILPGLTLVISPLIALMKDQVDSLCARKIDACFINSSLNKTQREKRYRHLADGKYKLLYVTPERFRKPDFLAAIAKRKVSLLAVDEAHCISSWGHDFRPDYTRVGDFIKQLGSPPVIALTATATPQVQQDIIKQLALAQGPRLFHQGIDRPNLSLAVQHVCSEDQKIQHIRKAISTYTQGSTIVYFTLIKTLDQFSQRLRQEKIPHLCYHGQLDPASRKKIQEQFIAQPNAVVLATNAFGMGIDKANIRCVIHADVPSSMESYYQEIGRAGRDGKKSQCLLLYDPNDLMTQMQFMDWSNPDALMYQRVYHHLQEDLEKIHAFGYDWLKEKLHAKKAKHDHRLVTALAMMERYGVIKNHDDASRVTILTDLPDALCNEKQCQAKLRRDQEKLYTLVQYAKHTASRMQFIHHYFGLTYHPPSDEKIAPASDFR